MAAFERWWLGLSRRERLATALAATLALVATLYLVAIEPAWRTRERLAKELPALRAEAAQVDALRLEARRLKEGSVRVESPQDVQAAAARMLAERNLPASALRPADGDRLLIVLNRVDAANCLAALKEVSSELPVRVSAARITRVAPGLVDAEVTLTPVGRTQ